MTGDGPQIVIEGTREDWLRRPSNPDVAGPQPRTQPADPSGSVPSSTRTAARCGFRIASEAVRRMKEQTPGVRGDRLVDALFAWLTPDRQLAPDLNRFQVLVSDDGDTRIKRYGD